MVNNKTEFACPLCNNAIILEKTEIYCSNDDCMFNPTIMDLLNKLYERLD